MGRHWVRDVLDMLVDHDQPLDPALVSDLDRIAACVESGPSYAFRSPRLEDLTDAIAEAADLDDLSRLALESALSAGFQHATIFVLRQGDGPPFRQRVCTSYPEDWIARFRDRSYQYIDPIMARALVAEAAFEFRDAQGEGPIIEAFWQDAEAHGIGRHGLCCPIALAGGVLIGVSFATAEPKPIAMAAAARHCSDLSVVAEQLAETFAYLTRSTVAATTSLTPLELRFLHMLMTRDDPSAAHQLAPPFGSNRSLQASIRAKMGVSSIYQAVAIASLHRWFDDMPYDPLEVARANAALSGWDVLDSVDIHRLPATAATLDPDETSPSPPDRLAQPKAD